MSIRDKFHTMSVREWNRLLARREAVRLGAVLGALADRPRHPIAQEAFGARKRASMSVREWRRAHTPLLIEHSRRRQSGPVSGPSAWWPWPRRDLARVYASVGLPAPPPLDPPAPRTVQRRGAARAQLA